MSKHTSDPPLSNAVSYILLSLAESDRHGYGILQDVARLSDGSYKMGPGTLYDNLRTLLSNGLVRESEEQVSAEEVRRVYGLTPAGAAALTSELRRLDSLIEAGRSRLAANRTREAS